MPEDTRRSHPLAERLALASTMLSVVLLGGLVAAFVVYGSRLALAQAADSFSDIFTAAALLVSIRIALRPADDDHPFGHEGAEPIAALVAAVVAGVLAVEVLRDSITALLVGEQPTMGLPLLAIFLLKVAAKTVIALLARRQRRGERNSPALHALEVDARNDVAVGLLAVAGFFAARYGWVGLDLWLAIPVALYVGASGLALARENVRMLMGEAPPEQRRSELAVSAAEVAGVSSVHQLRARHHGAHLDVLVDVVVDPELRLRDAHDIGHAVEARLLEESDVSHAVVHLDVPRDDDDN